MKKKYLLLIVGSIVLLVVAIYTWLFFTNRKTLGGGFNAIMDANMTDDGSESNKVKVNNEKDITLNVATAREAVMETARAYFRKGKNIQYDGLRRQLYLSPEEATNQNTIYTVCSNYSFQVYYNALGIKIPMETKDMYQYGENIYKANPKSENLVLLDSNYEKIKNIFTSKNDTDRKEFMNNLSENAQPGDVIVIRRVNEDGEEKSGHIMIVEYVDSSNNNIQVINAVGSTYDTTNHIDKIEKSGSIARKENLEEYFKIEAKNDYFKIAVIRFITENFKYPNPDNVKESIKIDKMTDAAKTRIRYPDIDISKTYSIIDSVNGNDSENRVAELNDIIEYTIAITNNSSSDYNGLNIIETVDSKTVYTKCDSSCTYDGSSKVKWLNQSVPSGKTKIYKYRVRVGYITNNFGKEIVSTGYVNNIKTTTISHKIGINLSADQREAILKSYENLKDKTHVNGNYDKIELDFIIDVYKNAGLNYLTTELEKLYDKNHKQLTIYDLLEMDDKEKCPSINGKTNINIYCKIKLNGDYFKNILLNNMYGLRTDHVSGKCDDGKVCEKRSDGKLPVYSSYTWNWATDTNYYIERTRTIRPEELQIGDIIIAYTETNNVLRNKTYIYLGNGVMGRKHESTSPSASYSENKSKFFTNFIGDNYVILRPALYSQYYTIKYNANGGNGSARYKLAPIGYGVELSTNGFTKTGYSLSGWNTKADGTGDSYTSEQYVTNLTNESGKYVDLYAVWSPIQYVVTFNSNGGSSVTSQTINYNGKITKPNNPTKVGYTFKKWLLNGSEYDFNKSVTSNLTLTAEWEQNDGCLKDLLQNKGYSVSVDYVSMFTIGDSITTIKSKLGNSVTIESKTTIISTGTVIKKGNESYTVIVKGDLNGDGKINSGDLLQMRKYLLEEVNLTGAYKQAGIIESNNEIKSLDLLRLRQYLLGEYRFN